MIITLDNSTFTFVLNPDADPPIDPNTGKPLLYAKERVTGLIENLGQDDRLIVPTPVLAEALALAGEAGREIVEKLQDMARLVVAPFDQRSAYEFAVMHQEAVAATGSKKGNSSEPWQKVKFDRQIIAIAKVNSSDLIYSDDANLCKFARTLGLDTESTWELTVPEKTPDLFEG